MWQNKKNILVQNWSEFLLPVALALLSIAWLFFSPPLSAPDEAAHILVPREILLEHRLPVLTRTSDGWENHQPPLYYVLSTPFVWASQHMSLYHQIQFDRLTSFFLFLLSLVACIRTSRLLWPSHRMARVAMLSSLGIPMVVYSSGSFNNDILALTISCWLLLLAASKKNVIGPRNAIILGVCVGAGLLTKVNLYPYLAVMGLWILRRQSWKWWLLCIVTSIAVSGWWFVHNITQVGDVLGIKYATTFFLSQHQDITSLSVFRTFLEKTLASFIGLFGKLNIRLPIAWYAATYGLLIGACIFGFRRPWNAIQKIFVITAVVMFAGYLWQNSEIFQPQGRYLISVIPLFGCVFGYAVYRIDRRYVWIVGAWLALLLYGNIAGMQSARAYEKQNGSSMWSYPRTIDGAAEIHALRPKLLVRDSQGYSAHTPVKYIVGGDFLDTRRNIVVHIQTAEVAPLQVRVEWRIAGQRWYTAERSYETTVVGSAALPISEVQSTGLIGVRLSFLDTDRTIRISSIDVLAQ